MTEKVHEQTVGECTVCSNSLPVGANHAYTRCKHLFCISCLLKWCKANPRSTCPMCRAPLCEDEPVVQEEIAAQAVAQEEEEAAAFDEPEQQDQRTILTVQEMDFNQDERYMHDYMMLLVDIHAAQYCRTNPMCTYIGITNLYTIPNRESDYNRIEVGIQNANCHYAIELRDSSRAFRYKFGRIEDIVNHHLFEGVSWFVFRELVDILDDDTGYMHTVWSNETQSIAVQGGDVISLRQYVPRIRRSV